MKVRDVPAVLVALAVAGCMGRIGDGQEGPSPGADGAAGTGGVASPVLPPSRLTAPLRRLSRLQCNNTIRDLLGDESRPADAFLLEEVLGTFSGSAELARAPAAVVEQ
jgi:hypothetical protein